MDIIQRTQSSPNLVKYKPKFNEVYKRIPPQVRRQKPIIEKLVFPEPLIIYEGLGHFDKSEKIKIPKGISESKKKKINLLNEFKDAVYKFNMMKKTSINNEGIKEENIIFSKEYKRLLKEKNKYNTGTYIDQQYLIPIANQYIQRNMKIPKISHNNNIFKPNPLILTGIDLENYFLYNFGEKYKSSVYLEKLDKIVNRKLTGNFILSEEELKRLKFLKENEKPKGYIPLKKLIPKLQKDINETQKTIDNLEKEENNKKVENNTSIIYIKEGNKHSAKTRNKYDNLYFDYSTNISNSSQKIKRSLSLINYNKYVSRINSSVSIKENKSKRFSFLNSHIALPYMSKNNKSNISSAISRDKERLIHQAKIQNKNILNYIKKKILEKEQIRALFSGQKRISNTIESDNINTINSINSVNSISQSKKFLRKSLKSINSINPLTLIGRGSLISAIPKGLKRYSLCLKKEIPKTTNDNNYFDNIFKRKKKEVADKNKISTESQRKEDYYEKCENIFYKILQGKLQSNRSKSVLSEFLKNRGYKGIKKYDVKDNVLNMNRMQNKSSERNYIFEEFKLRNRDTGKLNLTEQQKAIINKNELLIKEMQKNEYKFKRLICEKNMYKEEYYL